MYYNPNWFISSIFLLSTLVPFLWWFQQVLKFYIYSCIGSTSTIFTFLVSFFSVSPGVPPLLLQFYLLQFRLLHRALPLLLGSSDGCPDFEPPDLPLYWFLTLFWSNICSVASWDLRKNLQKAKIKIDNLQVRNCFLLFSRHKVKSFSHKLWSIPHYFLASIIDLRSQCHFNSHPFYVLSLRRLSRSSIPWC
jgi:hypothetical protein